MFTKKTIKYRTAHKPRQYAALKCTMQAPGTTISHTRGKSENLTHRHTHTRKPENKLLETYGNNQEHNEHS